jgi:hypothetical protein
MGMKVTKELSFQIFRDASVAICLLHSLFLLSVTISLRAIEENSKDPAPVAGLAF